jgi:hypothetical protein
MQKQGESVVRSLIVILASLALCSACSTVPTDATWVGRDGTRSDFFDVANWSPSIVPTGIATVPPTNPPQPLSPLVTINKPVSLLELRQRGGAVSGAGELKFGGAGWSICGKYSNTGFDGIVQGNVHLCADDSPDFGYGQSGTLIGDVTVLGGSFGALIASPSSPGLTVTKSVVVDQTGGIGVQYFPGSSVPILAIQGSLAIKGNSTILWLFVVQDVPSQTVIPIRAAGGIAGCFSKVIVTSPNYSATYRCRANDVEVVLTRLSPRSRTGTTTADYSWMPWARRPPPR